MADTEQITEKFGEQHKAIDELLRADIDKIFVDLDVKALLKSPNKSFQAIVDTIILLYTKKYQEEVIVQSLKYGKDVVKNAI